MLIPKQWEARHAFMIDAAKVLGATTTKFLYYDCVPGRRDELDFSGYPDAMASLCSRLRLRGDGVEDLRLVVAVWTAHHEAVRAGRRLPDEEFQRGLVHAQRLRHWLRQTFPGPM